MTSSSESNPSTSHSLTWHLKTVVTVLALLVGAAGCGKSSHSSSATQPASASKTTTTAGAAKREVSPAGDIPDNQAYVAFAPPGQGYSVKVPEGWGRVAKGRATVFTDKLNSIRMEQVSQAQPPTISAVTSTVLPELAKMEKHFRAGPVTKVQRSAGPAVLVRYRADGPPDPVTTKVRPLAVERYEFWRKGHAVILTLSGATGADNVDPWKIVTNSFGWDHE